MEYPRTYFFFLSFSGPEIESPFCHILSVSLWEMVTAPNLVFVLICHECSVHRLTELCWWLNRKTRVSQSAWPVITEYHKPISIHSNGWFSYSAANPGSIGLCQNSLFLWGHGHVGLQLTSMASVYINHVFKGPVSKYNHIAKSWDLGLDGNLQWEN